MTKPLPLSKLECKYGETITDGPSQQQVFHVENPHTLIQAAGYLKHIRATSERKGVFFRGQSRLYDELAPALLRETEKTAARDKRLQHIRRLLEQIRKDKKALRAVDADSQEALLQHYGIRTTWLDVVDNIWVALWFACHEAKSTVRGYEEYLHFERRSPHHSRDPEYAYVLLVESAAFTPVDGKPGHFHDSNTQTVDLRVAAPSQFIRPHAQHGLLVRHVSTRGLPFKDCRPMHVGTIRIDLGAALDWLGSSSTLTIHALFPPAYYDYGYRELLEHVLPGNACLGRIHRVQP